MQSDGNLVLYSNKGAVWVNFAHGGNPGARLAQ